MVNLLILMFLILHIVGDIYFKQKEVTKYNRVLLNSLTYLLLLLIPFLFFDFNISLLFIGFIFALINFILNTFYFFSKSKPIIKNNSFIWIQLIQISLIILMVYLSNIELVKNWFSDILIQNPNYLKWILGLLLIGKPSNLVFKNVFMQFKPVEHHHSIIDQNKTFKNAGAAIGTLERVLMLICLVNNLFSSIGLILTAKSIARYNRISEDPEFSEYYLLGTLSSVLFTIIIYYISFNLF